MSFAYQLHHIIFISKHMCFLEMHDALLLYPIQLFSVVITYNCQQYYNWILANSFSIIVIKHC